MTGLMMERFNDIIDVEFTANMENRLDAVEEGNAPAEAPQQEAPKAKPTLSLRHKENDDLAYSGSQTTDAGNQPAKAKPRVGRNDPCPCGSGKKYKKCCGMGKV